MRTVEESAQIERVYKQYFDLTLVNDDFEETYRELKKALSDLSAATQWVPVDWVYWNYCSAINLHLTPIIVYAEFHYNIIRKYSLSTATKYPEIRHCYEGYVHTLRWKKP